MTLHRALVIERNGAQHVEFRGGVPVLVDGAARHPVGFEHKGVCSGTPYPHIVTTRDRDRVYAYDYLHCRRCNAYKRVAEAA